MLNPEAPLPLYAQLAERLTRQIQAGTYAPGSRLPSEPELAKSYGIGRPTVRQATDVLVSRRLVERRRGSGTFVLERPPEVDVFSVSGTLASFKAKGLELGSKLVEDVDLVRVGRSLGNPLSGKQAYRFSRVSWLESEPAKRGASSRRRPPILLERFWLDAFVFAGIERMHLGGRSLAQLVRERFYLEPLGGWQSFRVGYLCGKLARAMRVSPRHPLLWVQRSLSFERAPDALFSELYCRADEIGFVQQLGERLDA